jgi:hypothetical protein
MLDFSVKLEAIKIKYNSRSASQTAIGLALFVLGLASIALLVTLVPPVTATIGAIAAVSFILGNKCFILLHQTPI